MRTQKLRPLCAERSFRYRRFQLGPDLHGRCYRSSAPRITTAALGHRRQRFNPGPAHGLRNGAQTIRARRTRSVKRLRVHHNRSSPLLSAQSDVQPRQSRHGYLCSAMSVLLQRIHGPDPNCSHRVAQPFCLSAPACAHARGVPLGVASRRGGKGSGFVYTILLVSLYYFLSFTATALAKQDKLPAFLAVWSANLLFAGVASSSLQMASGASPGHHHSLVFPRAKAGHRRHSPSWRVLADRFRDKLQLHTRRPKSRNAFPRILDEYVVREFLSMFLVVLTGFVLLMLVFTFFDLIGDILRNHIPLTTSASTSSISPPHLYQIAPLACSLPPLSPSVLNRNKQIIAMKPPASASTAGLPIVSISASFPSASSFSTSSICPSQPPSGGPRTPSRAPPQTLPTPKQRIFGQPIRRTRPHLLLPIFIRTVKSSPTSPSSSSTPPPFPSPAASSLSCIQ